MHPYVGPGALAGAAEAGGGDRYGGDHPDTTSQRRAPPRPRVRAAAVDFAAVNRAALARLADILLRWLPGGRIEGREYVARNPNRHDRRPGSFKINLDAGRWADFATGDRGGDPVALAAYLAGCSQIEGARRLAAMLGLAGGTSPGTGTIGRHGCTATKAPSGGTSDADQEWKRNRRLTDAAFEWSKGGPIGDTGAEIYLRARGIDPRPLRDCSDLRFGADATDRDINRSVPALLARFRSPAGALTGGIHRIFLKPDFSWHAGKKKMLGPPATVMLGPIAPDGGLGVGEGIESTAAAMQLFGVPGWAGVTAGGMAKLAKWLWTNPTSETARAIRHLLIWNDADPAGRKAAQELLAAASALGINAAVYEPPAPFGDWADATAAGWTLPKIVQPEPIEPAYPLPLETAAAARASLSAATADFMAAARAFLLAVRKAA
jgi:hypothetical protein